MSNENNTDLTTGSVSNHLRRLAIPAATGMLFHTLYNIVDIYFAGRLSTESQAGMAIGYLTFFFLVSFGFGLNGAMASLVGNAIGRKDSKTLEELTTILEVCIKQKLKPLKIYWHLQKKKKKYWQIS